MSKLNQQLFEQYSETFYYKTNKEAIQHFKYLEKFPDALGFDKESGGFIILHKKHKAGGLVSEIDTCIILKKAGFGVVLVQEYDNEKSVDVEIEGKVFEIKQLVNTDNLTRAIQRHFQRTYSKTNNLVLHIVQPIYENKLKGCLKEAAETFPSIKRVWLVYKNQIYKLDRKMIVDRKYNIQK